MYINSIFIFLHTSDFLMAVRLTKMNILNSFTQSTNLNLNNVILQLKGLTVK